MDSNTKEERSESSTCSMEMMQSAQNFDDGIIEISSGSEKCDVGGQNVPNVITQPLSSDSDGNGKNLNNCQSLFASESSSYKRKTPEVLDSGDETERELNLSETSEDEGLRQMFPPKKRRKKGKAPHL